MNNFAIHLVQYIGFSLAQFTNLLLLYIIANKAKKLLGGYRYVMIVFVIYSLFYSWIEIAVSPVSLNK